MSDTARPSMSELSPRQKTARKRRAKRGTESTMNTIEDRIREDLSLIRIRIETFDYGEKGRYYYMGYMSALATLLLDAMSQYKPERLAEDVSISLSTENQRLTNSEHMPIWKKFFLGRTNAMNNVQKIIANSMSEPSADSIP